MTKVRPDKPDGVYHLAYARPERMTIGQQDTAKTEIPAPQTHQTRAEAIDLDAVAATNGDYPDLSGLVGAHEHDAPPTRGGRRGLAA